MYYYVVRVSPLAVLIVFAAMVLASGDAERRGGEIIAERDACYEKFAAIGLTEQDAAKVSDKRVVEVCGLLPEYKINRAWHVDLPGGNLERFAACQTAFEEAGYTALEMNEASDELILDICETIPKYLSW